MTEQRSALDNALDLLVYAPVGLALTAAEELPKFAAKGRAQVEGQISVARMIGQFAVAQGRKEIEKRLGGSLRGSSPSRTEAAAPGRPETSSNGVEHAHGAENGSYERLSGRPEPGPGGDTARNERSTAGTGETPGTAETAGTPEAVASVIDVDFGATSGSGPVAGGLAIPGYDSLSASQVVQRLAGLSQDELAAVGEYEAAHRGRRTVLTRVGQLKG